MESEYRKGIFEYQQQKKIEERMYNKFRLKQFKFDKDWITGSLKGLPEDVGLKMSKSFKQHLKHAYYVDNGLPNKFKGVINEKLKVNKKTFNANIEDLIFLCGIQQ